jgi:alpha-methylacyl-CoA racemase
MIDGAASLGGVFYALHSMGAWSDDRGCNLLDGGAPFYDTYETADGKYVAVGALEPQFFAELARRIGLDEHFVARQSDRAAWPELRTRLTEIFRSRTRAQWCDLLEGSDACVAPVLSLDEAPGHAHHRARHAFIERDGVVQPAPAPRFSRTPGETAAPLDVSNETAEDVLSECGFTPLEIAELYQAGALVKK